MEFQAQFGTIASCEKHGFTMFHLDQCKSVVLIIIRLCRHFKLHFPADDRVMLYLWKLQIDTNRSLSQFLRTHAHKA